MTNNVYEIKPGLFWIGESVAGLTIKNAYLLIEGDEGVLFDPGFFHRSIIGTIVRKWPNLKLKYIVYPTVNFEHYPLIWELSQADYTKDSKIVVHEIHRKFLEPLKLGEKLLFVVDHTVRSADCDIRFIPVEVLNFPGTLFAYLEKYKTLLSGPIFGSLYEKRVKNIYVEDPEYFKFVESFHRGYHITSRYLAKPIDIVKTLHPEILGPSTGLLYRGKIIEDLVNFLAVHADVEETFFEELADNVMEIITTALNIRDALPRIRDLITKNTAIKDIAILTLNDPFTLTIARNKEKLKLDEYKKDSKLLAEIEEAINRSAIFEFDLPTFAKYLEEGKFYLVPLKIQHGPKSALVISVEGELDEDLKGLLYKILPAISAAVDRENIYERLILEIERYKDQIWTDSLTGLYNKNYLLKEAGKIFASYERYGNHFSLVMFDIDDFKKINDTYGHLVGDVVLEDFGEIIRRYSRKTDIPIRFGGEEFLVILPHTRSRGAYIFSEKIRNIIRKKKFRTKNAEFTVSVSAGVAGTDILPGVKDFDELVKYADMALYEAKKRGKDQTVIYKK